MYAGIDRGLALGADVRVHKLPWINMPRSQFGFVYETMKTAFLIVITAYAYLLYLNNTQTLPTYNLYRQFRVYIWLMFLTNLFDLILRTVDWAQLIHAWKDTKKSYEMACAALGLVMKEQMKNFPNVSGTLVLADMVQEFLVRPGAVVLITFQIYELVRWDPTNNGILNVYQFLVIEFVLMMVFSSLTLLGGLGMAFTRDHKVGFRVMAHVTFYWAALLGITIAIYVYMLQFFQGNHDGLTTNTDKTNFETLVWVGLLRYALIIYETLFTEFRRFWQWEIQSTFFPFTYGF